MSNWWNQECKVGERIMTPTEYLRLKYNEYSDSVIAAALSEICGTSVTKNAVKKRRHKLGLYKEKRDNESPKNEKTQGKEFNEHGNHAEAKAEVSTVDELIKACNIDTKIWDVASFKTWQGYGKVDGEIVTIPLCSAAFVRKIPIEVRPVVKPIKGNVTYSSVPRFTSKSDKNVKTSLVFSDPHFGFTKDLRNAKLTPFHNRQVLNLILQIAIREQPDRIDILGDMLDFAEWSDKFIRSPEFYWTTQPAVIEAHYYLALLREACQNTAITVHQGNHDKRPEIAIEKHMASAYDLKPTSKLDQAANLSLRNLLDLDSLGIKYVGGYPDDHDSIGNDLQTLHGKKALGPFRTVQDVAKNSLHNSAFGHVHRLEYASYTHWNGMSNKVVEAISSGCTCWIDGRVPGVSKQQQWQNGLLKINYNKNNYQYSIIPIKENTNGEFSCIYENEFLTSYKDSYVVDLKRQYDQWNW